MDAHCSSLNGAITHKPLPPLGWRRGRPAQSRWRSSRTGRISSTSSRGSSRRRSSGSSSTRPLRAPSWRPPLTKRFLSTRRPMLMWVQIIVFVFLLLFTPFCGRGFALFWCLYRKFSFFPLYLNDFFFIVVNINFIPVFSHVHNVLTWFHSVTFHTLLSCHWLVNHFLQSPFNDAKPL